MFTSCASVVILGFIIYNVINILNLRGLLKRFGFLKLSRRDFYECGFKPITQKAIRLPIQFLIICVFFLVYDVELLFILPFISVINFLGGYDMELVGLFFFCFVVSLNFDYNRHAMEWQY
jgi:NADH:ubiquinone oxidoreductase subunit 3 (subunit A)